MKNILYKTGLILILGLCFSPKAVSQTSSFPLMEGDVLATCKYDIMGGINNTGPVLFLISAANTIGAPMNGEVWTTSYPALTKKPTPITWSYADLGSIFGITIDNNKRIYVSNTSIYGTMHSTNKSSIYMIDGSGTSYAVKVVASPNTASTPAAYMPQLTGQFGNLKFATIGNEGFLFVSDFGSEKIHCLKELANGDLQYKASFNPAFGSNSEGQKAYGLALRKVGTGYKLYYGRMGLGNGWTQAQNSLYGSNKNQIWCVDVNADGTFGSVETQQHFDFNGDQLLEENPVSDIAFNSDQSKMLFAQQSVSNGGDDAAAKTLGAHASRVYELVESPGKPNYWKYVTGTAPIYNSGNSHSSYLSANRKNAVGGISYSNLSLQTNSTLKCDDAVWMSSDFIYFSGHSTAPNLPYPSYVYGLQAMKTTGGDETNSINIDLDDDCSVHDKYHLGDVEVFKSPLNCSPCACGSWENTPILNDSPIKGVPAIRLNTEMAQAKISSHVGDSAGHDQAQLLKYYPIQFVQGTVSGALTAKYVCNGSCDASYSWTVTGGSGVSGIIASGGTNTIDLATINSKLKCGQYTLTLKAFCGGSNCGNYVIPITIICEPPSCCVAEVNAVLSKVAVSAKTNLSNPNALSSGSFEYNLNYSLPMSEIRASIEEFKLVSTSPNCLNESNMPATWANIVSASLNGTPMILSGMVGPTSGTASADYREAVYNTGTPLTPSSATVKLQLSLPLVTELQCCEVSAYICVKFTFKDTQCRECVKMICGTVKLVPRRGRTDSDYYEIKEADLEIKNYDIRH